MSCEHETGIDEVRRDTPMNETYGTDISVLSKTCKGCRYWKGKEAESGYFSWLNGHECAINFDGSDCSMNKKGVVSTFNRSMLLYNVRYKTYIGDEDANSFSVTRTVPNYAYRT